MTADIKATVALDLNPLERARKGARIAVIRAAQRAAKPVRASAEAHAQSIRRYGFLAKSFGTKTRVYTRGGLATVIGPKMSYSRVKGKYTRGPRKGQGRRHTPYRYAWLLERGTKRSRKRPFLRPALDQQGLAYRRRLAAEVEAELAKLLG